MTRLLALGALAGALFLGAPADVEAQAAGSDYLAVGEMAPDIQVVGADRYGILRESVNLSDYRGETVVLAFFFRARTRG